MSIGQSAPSFAGYFIDSTGSLVVWDADSSEFATARSIIQARLASSAIGLSRRHSNARVIIRKADFTFQQLSDWRDIVSDSVLGITGVAFDDMDETRNRVTIGVDRDNFAALQMSITPVLARLKIPVAAVYFQPSGLPVPATARPPIVDNGSLNIPADTLGGGVEFAFQTSGGVNISECTVGFNADSAGTPVFFSASHCTDHEFAVDGSLAKIYTVQAGGLFEAAYESGDPPPTNFMCHGFLNMTCDWSARNSDAALYHIVGGHWGRGQIARPDQRVSLQNGSSNIDLTNPWLYVVRTGTAVSGDDVDHIGWWSGWNYGTITNTCTDVHYTNAHQNATFGVFCQEKANDYAHPGDSGGPVFNWDGQDGVTLYGTTVAADSISSGWVNLYFSSFSVIMSDFGLTGVIDPTTGISLSSETASGSISGSNPVPSWTTPTVTNGSGSQTTFDVYRATFTDGVLVEPSEIICECASSATSYLDLATTVTAYNGTLLPPHNNWVSYKIIAYNKGTTSSSATIYFKTN